MFVPCILDVLRQGNQLGGEDVGNLLRGVELARLLAGPGGKLADQVFIGIAQRVDVRGELRQPLGDLLDDGAELGIPILILLAQMASVCMR